MVDEAAWSVACQFKIDPSTYLGTDPDSIAEHRLFDANTMDCRELFDDPVRSIRNGGPDHICPFVASEAAASYLESVGRSALLCSLASGGRTIAVGGESIASRVGKVYDDGCLALGEVLDQAIFTGNVEAVLVIPAVVGGNQVTSFCTVEYDGWRSMPIDIDSAVLRSFLAAQQDNWFQIGIISREVFWYRQGKTGPVAYQLLGDPLNDETRDFVVLLNRWWSRFGDKLARGNPGRPRDVDDWEVQSAYAQCLKEGSVPSAPKVTAIINEWREEEGRAEVNSETVKRRLRDLDKQGRLPHANTIKNPRLR